MPAAPGSRISRALKRVSGEYAQRRNSRAVAAKPWTDMRLVPATIMVWLMSWFGVRSAEYTVFPLVVVGLLPASAIAALVMTGGGSRQARRLWRKRLRSVSAATVMLSVVGGIALWSGYGQSVQRTAEPVYRAVEQRATLPVELRLLENPRGSVLPGRTQFSALVVQTTWQGSMVAAALRVQVSASTDWAQFRRGEVVRAIGTLTPTEPGDPASARMTARTPGLKVIDAPATEAWLSGLRERFVSISEQVWGSALPAAAALLPGIVFGDRSLQSAELLEAMKVTGLTHLTAVSGTNCSIVLAGIVLLARSMRVPRFWSAGAAAIGLLGFVTLVGPDPSVLRAASMGALGVLALLSGRPSQAGPLLCVVALILLLADPWLSGSFGFVLSVLATAGLIGLGPPLRRWLGRLMPDWLAALLAIPLAAQLTVAPVIVLLQPRLTSYAVLANLFAAPVVALCTIAGILALCLLAFLPWAAFPLIAGAGLGAGWIAGLAGFFQGLPGAALPWWEGWAGVAAMIMLSGSLLFLLALIGAEPSFRRRLGASLVTVPGVGALSSAMVRHPGALLWAASATASALLGAMLSGLVLGAILPLPP